MFVTSTLDIVVNPSAESFLQITALVISVQTEVMRTPPSGAEGFGHPLCLISREVRRLIFKLSDGHVLEKKKDNFFT